MKVKHFIFILSTLVDKGLPATLICSYKDSKRSCKNIFQLTAILQGRKMDSELYKQPVTGITNVGSRF